MNILLDTDIIIDLLRGVEKSKDLLTKLLMEEESFVFVSVITEIELFSGKECNDINIRSNIESLLTRFNKVEVDSHLAKRSGELRRSYGIEVPDAIIAASALKVNAILYSRNKKDFNKIKELKYKSPY